MLPHESEEERTWGDARGTCRGEIIIRVLLTGLNFSINASIHLTQISTYVKNKKAEAFRFDGRCCFLYFTTYHVVFLNETLVVAVVVWLSMVGEIA